MYIQLEQRAPCFYDHLFLLPLTTAHRLITAAAATLFHLCRAKINAQEGAGAKSYTVTRSGEKQIKQAEGEDSRSTK